MSDNWAETKINTKKGRMENGIFYYNKKMEISYPEYGNAEYFGIEDKSFWFKYRNSCIEKIIENSGINGEIADIGGGNGFVSKMMQEIGMDVMLVEPGENGVINAKKRGIKKIICGAFDREMFEEEIENAGLFDVLEHIEDDKKFIEDIYRIIRKNGKIIITVPAFNLLWSNEDEEVGHFRRYRLKEIEKTVENAGFKIEYSSYLFSFLWIPLFLLRTIPSFFGVRKKSSEERIEKEHRAGVFVDRVLRYFEKLESKKIEKSKKIKFGTSCIIVAKK